MIFSQAGAKMASPSGIRSIMDDIATSTAAAAGRPWINLGIGNPAFIPEVAAVWQRLTTQALADRFGAVSCRYGPSRGAPELIRAIVSYFRRRFSWDIGPQHVVVGPGSQMLCFAAAAIFTGPGTSGSAKLVLPMLPDYTGYQGLCLNPNGILGIDPQIELEGERSFRYRLNVRALDALRDTGMMLLSSPSNPAGRSLSAADMDQLIRAAVAFDARLMIDNAYGQPFPCIGSALAPVWHENVINCFSLSKAGLAGERIGFAVGSEKYIEPIVSFLANSLLHAPALAQQVVARALDSGVLDSVVSSAIRPFYEYRRRSVEALLSDALPAEIAWRLHASSGGMFCWIWIDNDWFDDLAFYEILKDKHVFVVPGRHFFVGPGNSDRLARHSRKCFRVSISADETALTDGVNLIVEALREMQSGTARNIMP